jgi:hypothetical protein
LGDLHSAQDASVLRVQTHKRTDAEVVATSFQDYLPDDVAWLFFGYFGGVSRWSVAGLTHGCAAPFRLILSNLETALHNKENSQERVPCSTR